MEEFRKRHPEVRVRAVGQNSAEVADAVRDGRLEAGLVILPVDDRGLEVRAARTEELLYVSADPERLQDADDDRAPRGGAADPLRRPLGGAGPDPRAAARARPAAGVRLEPLIEVEYMTAALDLAARGLGDTVSLRLAADRARSRAGSAPSPFDPPIDETFAFITRRNAHLSPRHPRVHGAGRAARAGAERG